jgi:phosphopantothenoylcysteine decarboxylase/phosphopantothenate--cysteine ligase
MAAAVADFRPSAPADRKLKKTAGSIPTVPLEQTRDVLLSTRGRRRQGSVTVGFALETDDAVANGRSKMESKGLDLVIVNDVNETGAGFEVATNRVTILTPSGGDEELPLMSKEAVADEILDRVERLLEETPR